MPETILQVRQLSVHFEGSKAPALRDVSFDLNRGEAVAVLGESGAGKTTLARVLLRLEPQSARTEGRIDLFGVNLFRAKAKVLQTLRGSRVCLIPQEPELALNPVMRVRDHIAEVVRAHLGTRSERRAKVEMALEAAGLTAELGLAYPHQLSGGQRQRVVIAQALACEPELLIADEPTSALDKVLEAEILAHLMRLVQARGLALILITHDPRLAWPLAGRVLVLRQGRLLQSRDLHLPMKTVDPYVTKLFHSVVPPPLVSREIQAIPPTASHPHGAAVEVKNLSKIYRRGRFGSYTNIICALDDVSLRVPEGSVLALVGSSGAGKSTLARCLALLETPKTGEIRFLNEPVRYHVKRDLQCARTKVQLVWQHSAQALNSRLRAIDIVAEPLQIANWSNKRDAQAYALDMMTRVGLPASFGFRRSFELSGGQRQRVALARALILHPALLVLDEPFAGLDLPLIEEIVAILLDAKAAFALTYVFITHDLRRAASLADELCVMHNGKIVEQGGPSTIFWRPKHEVTQQLVAAASLNPSRYVGV